MLNQMANARTARRILGVLTACSLVACSGESTAPRVAVAIVYTGNPALSAAAGTAISPAPTIQIRDAAGDPIPGVSFSVSVTAGGGSVAGTPLKTTSGSTALGTWTLGTGVGAHSLTVTSGSLAPLVINATSTPGVPTTSASGGGPLTAGGTVGAVAVITPSIRITDAFGNNVPNIAVTTSISGGGSVATPSPSTNGAGIASAGTWTLGTTAGAQSVVLSAAGVASVTFTVSAAAGPAANVAANSVTTANGTPGTLAPYQPAIRVTDAFGNGVAGVVVSTTVSAGGTLQFTSPATNAVGIATVGNWTTAVAAGDNTVTMTAPSFSAVTFTVTTSGAAAPASLTTVAGSFQTAAPGAALATNPVFRVKDVADSPIVGATVQFLVLSGGGNVTTTSAVTDAQGNASPGTWTLGATPGSQRLRASVGGLTQTLYATALRPAGGTYNIVVRYVGTPPAVAVQTAINNVVTRLQAQIVADLPSQTVNVNIAGCITGGPVVNETIDDLILYVKVGPIDGTGGPIDVLGGAGWCWIQPGFVFPSIGVMELDEANVGLLTAAQLEMTVLHELHHVLGVGTLWESPNHLLIQGAGTSNPVYLGAAGNAQYFSSGGTSPAGIRIENTGGEGTQDAHWRESLFGNELLTGGLNNGLNPLSAFSIMSLADFGYAVSTAGADPYAIPMGALRTAQQSVAPVQLREILIKPIYVVGPDGRLRPMRQQPAPLKR